MEELRLQSRENPPGAVAGTGAFGLSPNASGSGTGTAVGVFGNIGGAFGGGSTIPSTFGHSGPGSIVPPAGSMFTGGGAGGFGGGSGGFNAGAGFGGATGGFGASSAVPNAFGDHVFAAYRHVFRYDAATGKRIRDRANAGGRFRRCGGL